MEEGTTRSSGILLRELDANEDMLRESNSLEVISWMASKP